MIKTLIFKGSLSNRDSSVHQSLIRLLYDFENKEIRVRLVGITPATKGTSENKVYFDIQIVTNVNRL